MNIYGCKHKSCWGLSIQQGENVLVATPSFTVLELLNTAKEAKSTRL